MMRSIIISALLFFGPAMLMFVFRRLFLIARLWFKLRRLRQQQEHDVIDITPHRHGSPSMLFNIAAILVGLICAFLAWHEMNQEPEATGKYVPAHVDDQGKVIPGKMVPADERKLENR